MCGGENDEKRNDSYSTEFGLWLRNQDFKYEEGEVIKPTEKIREPDPLDSKEQNLIAHNIDYLWRNYEKDLWMLIEEKRWNKNMDWSQKKNFKNLHDSIEDDNYKGFHLIQFEKTSPEDGKTYIDHEFVYKESLIDFLKFDRDPRYYDRTVL